MKYELTSTLNILVIDKNIYLFPELFFSCPGRMIANSIPARLVAVRTCMSLPCACPWPHHAHAQGYVMHRDLASKIVG